MSSAKDDFSSDLSQPLVIDPVGGPARQAIIWLHGLGADGHDFEGIVPQLGLPEDHVVRFIFPHAPSQAVTVNGGMTMPAWYDIRSPALMEDVDWDRIESSASYIHTLIHEQMQDGIESNKIMLAGFSQGGLVALTAALRFNRRLAGMVAMSTYFPPSSEFEINQPIDLPIFWGHGTEDPVCDCALGEQSKEWLETQGYDVKWHAYPMAHQVCPDEIKDMGEFIRYYLVS